MSLFVDDELRRLRARAYGPNADIYADPAAVARLAELELLHADRAQRISDAADRETDVDREDDVDPAVRALFGSTTSVDGDERPLVAPVAESAPSRPRLSRLTKVLWVGSLATTAALAAGIAVTVVGGVPVSASSGAPQIATLESTTAVTIPEGWLGVEEVASVYEFHDVTLFTPVRGLLVFDGADAVPKCLIIVRAVDVPTAEQFDPDAPWSFDSPFSYSSCGLGRFPATVEVPLNDGTPEELREAFPEARALQFVLDGDRVSVFLDDGA